MLTGKTSEKLRVNPRKSWYRNLAEVTANGDYEVTFHLTRPQPAFLALLASGYSPVYPCHIPPRDMRQHPIGTGPFKFIEFKPNEYIKVARNPDYWKKGRPYLDGIEYTIIRNLSTAVLAFVAGKFDMTFGYSVTEPLLKDVTSQMPDAICELAPIGVNRSLIVNRDRPPFDNPDLRRAMALSFDRKAFVDIITEGKGDIGGVMQRAAAFCDIDSLTDIPRVSGAGKKTRHTGSFLSAFAFGVRPTPRWREADSNSRSHLRARASRALQRDGTADSELQVGVGIGDQIFALDQSEQIGAGLGKIADGLGKFPHGQAAQ